MRLKKLIAEVLHSSVLDSGVARSQTILGHKMGTCTADGAPYAGMHGKLANDKGREHRRVYTTLDTDIYTMMLNFRAFL